MGERKPHFNQGNFLGRLAEKVIFDYKIPLNPSKKTPSPESVSATDNKTVVQDRIANQPAAPEAEAVPQKTKSDPAPQWESDDSSLSEEEKAVKKFQKLLSPLDFERLQNILESVFRLAPTNKLLNYHGDGNHPIVDAYDAIMRARQKDEQPIPLPPTNLIESNSALKPIAAGPETIDRIPPTAANTEARSMPAATAMADDTPMTLEEMVMDELKTEQPGVYAFLADPDFRSGKISPPFLYDEKDPRTVALKRVKTAQLSDEQQRRYQKEQQEHKQYSDYWEKRSKEPADYISEFEGDNTFDSHAATDIVWDAYRQHLLTNIHNVNSLLDLIAIEEAATEAANQALKIRGLDKQYRAAKLNTRNVSRSIAEPMNRDTMVLLCADLPDKISNKIKKMSVYQIALVLSPLIYSLDTKKIVQKAQYTSGAGGTGERQ